MKAATATTLELDDARRGAEELCSQISARLTLEKNSVGILFCDSDTCQQELLDALVKTFDFSIVGCTCIGTLDERSGFRQSAATLTVLTGEDCCFAFALSKTLTAINVEEEVISAYRLATDSLGETPKLILALPPYNLDIMLDMYPQILDKLSGGVPAFGGLPSANEGSAGAVFGSGGTHEDRIALLLIGGNVHLVFSVKNVLNTIAHRKRTVTKSQNNVVYRVGDSTFLAYLKEIGLEIKFGNMNETMAFLSNPLLIEDTQDPNEDGIPVVRALHALDLENEAGISIAGIPQGSTLSIGMLSRGDIERSAHQAIDELLVKMKENQDYQYSLVLCAGCVGRFMVMAPDCQLEGNVLSGAIGTALPLSGFYGYGELCPTSVQADGKARNRAHNESITLCAL